MPPSPSLVLDNRIVRKWITNNVLANYTIKKGNHKEYANLEIGCTCSHLVTSSTNPNRRIWDRYFFEEASGRVYYLSTKYRPLNHPFVDQIKLFIKTISFQTYSLIFAPILEIWVYVICNLLKIRHLELPIYE